MGFKIESKYNDRSIKKSERFRCFFTLEISVKNPNFIVFESTVPSLRERNKKHFAGFFWVKMKLVSNVEHINATILISSNLDIIRYSVQELFIALLYIFLR